MKDRGLISGTIAVIVVLAFCGFAIYVGIRPLPAANQHFIDITLGALVGQFANVIGYYFGSSRAADKNTERMPVTVPPPKPPPDNDFHQRDT